MMSTQTISEAQMEIFRSMTDSDGVTLNDNYRPPQPLNARTIYTTGVSRLVDLKRFTFFDESIHSQLYSRRTLYVDIPNNSVQTNCLLMFQVMSRHCLVGSLDSPLTFETLKSNWVFVPPPSPPAGRLSDSDSIYYWRPPLAHRAPQQLQIRASSQNCSTLASLLS